MRYINHTSVKPQLYAGVLGAELCEVNDVENENTLIDGFIEIVNSSIFYSYRHNWAHILQADLQLVKFQTKLLLSIRRDDFLTPATNKNAFNNGKSNNRNLCKIRSLAGIVILDRTITPNRCSQQWSESPSMLRVWSLDRQTSMTGSTSSSSSPTPCHSPFSCKVCFGPG